MIQVLLHTLIHELTATFSQLHPLKYSDSHLPLDYHLTCTWERLNSPLVIHISG